MGTSRNSLSLSGRDGKVKKMYKVFFPLLKRSEMTWCAVLNELYIYVHVRNHH